MTTTVEQFLRTSYEPHCEYLDAVIVPKPIADVVHSVVKSELIRMSPKNGPHFLPSLHLQISATRYRMPDVSCLLRIPPDLRYPDSTCPPLFVVEVVSPDELYNHLRDAIEDYLGMGVPTVILANPYDRSVMVATREHPLHELRPPLIVEIAVPEQGTLTIDFDHIYSQLPAASE